MYHGKHIRKSKRPVALLASLALVLGIMVAGTLAFLVTSDGPVVNTFTPTNVPPEIHEEFNGTVKSNVRIENQGNTDAYIRAAVMVNWVDGSGNVLGQVPELGSDYTVAWMPDMDANVEGVQNDWVKGKDGYHYFTKIVPATSGTDLTDILIGEAKVLKAAPVDGYELAIDIVAQTIQAVPENVVDEVWSNEKTTVTVGEDGVLSVTDTPVGGTT